MRADEARDLFSAAWDGELDAARRAELDAALAADPQLRAEWEEFTEMLRQAQSLGEGDEDETPDLLAGVQTRLRVRSRGRFYRDRFATQATNRSMVPIVLGLIMLAVVALAWLTLHVVRVDAPADAPTEAPATPG